MVVEKGLGNHHGVRRLHRGAERSRTGGERSV